MQTFLPYADFIHSARVLDKKRLLNQQSDTLKIMNTLVTGTGWVNDPAVLMWSRYEWALLRYQNAICGELALRGYLDSTYRMTKALYDRYKYKLDEPAWPYWLGSDIHISHQSNLMREDRAYYSQFFPGIPDYMDYVWPEAYDEKKVLDPTPWWSNNGIIF